MSTHPTQEFGSMSGWSLSAALRLSIAYSRKTDEEIAAEMGWGSSVSNRIFHNHDYFPSLPTIPKFCGVVGNTILAQWILDNTQLYLDDVCPMSAEALLVDLRTLMREMADVIEECEKALKDNMVDSGEARRINRHLADMLRVIGLMFARLQACICKRRESR